MLDCKKCKWHDNCDADSHMSCAHGQILDGVGDYWPADPNEEPPKKQSRNYLFDWSYDVLGR